MRQALEQIERLLRGYGHVYQANLVSIAHEGFARNPGLACHQINNDAWWNSTDAVAAVDLGVDGGFTPQARRDAQALRLALTEVYLTMRAYGERNEAAEITISQFQKWMESHV